FEGRRANGQLALTRNGNFRLDPAGRLVNQEGALVQPTITAPRGTTPDQLKVASDGTVSIGTGRALGRIQVVNVPSSDGLQPLGDNLFGLTAASGAARAAGRGTTVAQGTLEMSNVQRADAMTDMM